MTTPPNSRRGVLASRAEADGTAQVFAGVSIVVSGAPVFLAVFLPESCAVADVAWPDLLAPRLGLWAS